MPYLLIKDLFYLSQTFENTQYKLQERILRLLDARELHAWIGRNDIVSHLLSDHETDSRVVYHTLNSVISRICLGSGPGSLTFNEPWVFLNTQVMRHQRKEDFH